MDPDTSSIELSSPCSCDACDTLRCLTRNHAMLNDENYDSLSDISIFFTKVAVEKTSSNTDIALNETTPLKIKTAQETKCKICKRSIKNEGNVDTENACKLIDVINISKSVCESCVRNINNVKQQINNADLVIDAKPLVTKDSTEIQFEADKTKENKNCGKDTLTQQRPLRKSKCKICIKEFQTYDNVGDIKTDKIPFEKVTSTERIPNKPSFNNITENYFPPNIDTAKSKVCNKDTETREFAEGLEKINEKKSQCKFCKRYVDSQDRADDLICNICKAYIPTNITRDLGNTKERPSIFEICQNYLQTNINKTAMHILDTVKTKCRFCRDDTKNANDLKRCKFCKTRIVSYEEIMDSVCKICKAYFPINLYTNATNKDVKQSLFELCPNQSQNNINKTSVNINDTVKTKCERCKTHSVSDVGRKRCKFCRRFVESHLEIIDSICKNCKPFSSLDTNAVKSELLQTEKIGISKFESNICRKAICADKISTRSSENLQTRKTKPIKCKVCKQDIETKGKIKCITTESKCIEKPKYKVYKRAIEDWETDVGRTTTAYDSEMARKDSNVSLSKDRKIKIVSSEIKQRKVRPIFTPTEIKCTGKSKCKVCTMHFDEYQAAVDETIELRSELKKYNLNTIPCSDCRMDRVNSEIILTDKSCTGKSKCEVCRRYVAEWEETMGKNVATYKNIIPLCDFCPRDSERTGSYDTVFTNVTGKSKYKDSIGDKEEWETTLSIVNSEKTPPDTIHNETSLCQSRIKNNESKINTEKLFTKKSNCKFCKRNVEDWKGHCSVKTPDKKINGKSCKFCRMDTDKQGPCHDSGITLTKHNNVAKDCIKDTKMPNCMDTVNNVFTLIDQIQNSCCPRHTVELSKKTPVSCEKRIKSCDSKKSESGTRLCNRPHLCENIHPSTLKLTAQIMNLPYEEFKESFNQQLHNENKATMKSTLSNEIMKRIKEAYKACSCKVCECITGKSLTSSNVCNCKPCDCANCKSFKHLSHDIHSESRLSYLNKVFPHEVSVAKITQDQPCDCSPCSCIQCTQITTAAIAKSTSSPPVRTYIAARVSENRHADNCTCPACHCSECEGNFFSLSTHITHEMSTGMVSSCRCEQCVDQRCRGAGGTDDCRCEMPSKAIFKPVEKDSHDYGIHRAAVCHQRNKRNDCRDAIALYATVTSNYSQLRTVEEACSCEECECVSCKGENSKMSIKTILKSQPASQMQSTKTNTCDFKACECENCAYIRNVPDVHLINYKDAECNCDECNCMNCRSGSKSMIAKLPLAKPIGKIYYRNNIKECTDCNISVTKCSQAMGAKNQHNVCMKKMVNKNCCYKKDFDNTQKNKYIRYCCLDSQNSTEAKTCSVSQDLAKQILPEYAADQCIDIKLNKALNHINSRDTTESKNSCSKYDKFENSDSIFSELNHANCDKINKYGNKTTNLQPFQLTLSNYKAYCPKNSLETCLNDILTLDGNFKSKMGSNMNKPNITYNTATYDYEKNQDIDDIDVYNYMFEPFSSHHRNFYKENIDSVHIYDRPQNDIGNKCKIKKQTENCIIPSVVNCNNNFVKNQIDYVRVHNTLREAKDFSKQLMKLLDKYERANRDFQSVSEKLKISPESNECKSKDTVHFQIDYVVIEEQNYIRDVNDSVNRIEDVNYGLSDVESSLCSTNNANKNSNNTQNAIILVKRDQNEHSLQNKIILVEAKTNENLTSDGNLEMRKVYAHGRNIDSDLNDFNEITNTSEAQTKKKCQKTLESLLKTTNNNAIPEGKTFVGPSEDIATVQSSCVDSKAVKTVDKTNNNEIREKGDTIRNKIPQDAKVILPCQKNTYHEIDILTDRLSEIIKENVIKNYEESASSHVHKYDTTNEISENNVFLPKEKDDESQVSMNKTNFHMNNDDLYIPPYGLIFFKDSATSKMHASSAQTTSDRHVNKCKIEKLINLKSGSSLPRNKTTQVDKESDTRVDFIMRKHRHQKYSGSTLKSDTESDVDTHSRFTMSFNRNSAIGKPKCSCEVLKVGSLEGRRVSDHTVMVKWSRPKDLRNIQGYELLVDGRPVQTIIDSSRCMAVVTCLPNNEKVLLTMKTILLVGTKSGHEPSVTVVYHPRSKRNKNKSEQSK